MSAITLFIEVMDKEPALSEIWIATAAIGVTGFIVCRYNYKIIFFFLPLALFLSFGFYCELNDEFVRAAIRREAGMAYVYQSYIAMIVAIAAPVIGAVLGCKQQCRLTDRSVMKKK